MLALLANSSAHRPDVEGQIDLAFTLPVLDLVFESEIQGSGSGRGPNRPGPCDYITGNRVIHNRKQ